MPFEKRYDSWIMNYITKIKDLHILPKLRDSISFLYVEHAKIEQDNHAIDIHNTEGIARVPAANLSVLLLGPGTSITHAAMKALMDVGCAVNWVGEDNCRFYAQGLGETRKAYHLLRQAELCCDQKKHMEVVLRMYSKRFAERVEAGASLQVVRGKEGARVRQVYAENARYFGIPWAGRSYSGTDWDQGDAVNRALSAASACLNGICHTAIVSAGYSTALGFIHSGKQLSFVYDIADLYKAEITIPVGFRVVAEGHQDVESAARRACRELFRKLKLLEHIVSDIDDVLGIGNPRIDQEERLIDTPAGSEQWWSPEQDDERYW